MPVAKFGRGDMGQTAKHLADVLDADRAQWKRELESGATKPHEYETIDTVTCFLHTRDARQRGTVFRLEAIGGLPPGMEDPAAHGNTIDQAKWRLRWAMAAWWMSKRGGRVPSEVARARAKRAEIYVCDRAVEPAVA